MNRIESLALATLLTGGLLLGYGRKKERSSADPSPQEEQAMALTSARGDAQSHFTFDDVFDNVLGVSAEVGYGNTGVFGRTAGGTGIGRVDSIPPCVQLTVTRLSQQGPFPVRITVDFGSGCTGRDGRTRSGKIITEYSRRLLEPGAVATTTFDNYRIDSIRISGTQVVRNTSPANGRQFTIETSNARTERPNGDYTLWNSERVLVQTAGYNTPNLHLDDLFQVTGNSHGQSRRNNLVHNWTSVITQPLRKSFACRWITAGVSRTRRTGVATDSPWVGVLDYGQTGCDNQATLTLNGSTYQISLP